MFRKLVSNLPFSPSLINQVSFYSKRLKKEQISRQIGLIFTALAIVIQTLTVLAPAKATLAASTNDIIFGGGTKAGIQKALNSGCDSKQRCDLKAIFGAYGITSANFASAKTESIYSSAANNYWSIGRAPRGYGGEVSRSIPGGPTVYSRTLHGWVVNHNWPAYRVETAQGTRWVLQECGNIVTKEGAPAAPKPPADVKVEKTVNKSTAKRGDKVLYTIKLTNVGKGIAKNVLLTDTTVPGLELQSDGLTTNPLTTVMRWQTAKRFDMAPGQSLTYKLYAVVRSNGPTTLVNKACVDIIDINVYNNCDDVPVTVLASCTIPGKEQLSKDDPNCKVTGSNPIKCTVPGKETLLASDPNCKVTTPTQPEKCTIPGKENLLKTDPNCKITTVVTPVKCAVPGKENLPKDDPNCKPPCQYDATLNQDDPKCKACPISGKTNLPINSPECRPCDETKQTQDGKDISCLELHKKARNITQQLADANGTTAQAGDTIEYTLSVKNLSKQARSGFVIEENMEDVLEYADIIDASGATFTNNPVKMLSWAPITLKSGETATRTILVKIKSSLPNTPAATSDPLSSDMKLVNVYGDSVQIKLPKTPIKAVEQTVTRLPSTGIGANIAISTILLMAVTYFYFRNRTMVKELSLIRQQFNYGMGA